MVKAKEKKKRKKSLKKSVKKEKPKTETLNDVNPNQELFCQLYFGPGEFFGNGTWSYIKAFNMNVPLIAYSYLKTKEKKVYNVAKTQSYTLLTKPNIQARGKKILTDYLAEIPVDRELSWAIIQRKDIASKVQAIREFNKLKNRILDKIDLTSKGEKIQPIIEIIKYGTTAKN